MRHVMKLVRNCLLGLVGVCCLLTNCTVESECRQDYTARLQVVLQVDSVTLSNDTIRQEGLDSIRLWGAGKDSLWLNNQKNVSSLSLPLRVDTTCTEYVFALGDSGEEHFYIYHQNNPTFVSLACGCFVYYTIDSITCDGRWIDKIEILNAQVENVGQDNARFHITLKP